MLLLFWCLCLAIQAQDPPYFTYSGSTLELNNGQLKRSLSLQGDSLSGWGLWLAGHEMNYLGFSPEFSFLLEGQLVNGFSGWTLKGLEETSDGCGGRGVRLMMHGKDGSGLHARLELEITYLLYPDLPLVRKSIALLNRGDRDLKVEALNVEDLQSTLSNIHSVVLHNYARMKHLGHFTGSWHDPLVVVHHQSKRCGMALGNEAPGVMKRTAYHTRRDNIEVGLTHPEQEFPFRRWLSPGERWESPATFLCLYAGSDDAFAVVDGAVNDFVRLHMRPQIVRQQEKPLFVYNTWNPFRTFVSAELIREVAEAAAQCGIEEFIIDDGWQVNQGRGTSEDAWGNNYGDWLVDEEKFPGGLAPTFDHIRSLGMKPGLWMSIGSATADAAVYREHPQWFVENAQGIPGNLHSEHDPDFFTSCFGTHWVDYIQGIIDGLCTDYGLAYTKLDFAVVSSAYVNTPELSGCYATDHPLHADREESFLVIYERVLELFDRLHASHPRLFIDCTFETAGKLQLTDYAIARHAEGNWLSNFEEYSPTGPLRIRQMAWWRSPVVPAASLVIGNAPMDDPAFEFALKSLIGTLPIVLGDPRELSAEKRQRIRSWSTWMRKMQKRYNYMAYRRDLPGFGEPREGHWDGWMRINNDSREGGIVGVFRQGSAEEERRVVLKGLKPEATYQVRLAPEGQEVHRASGAELMTRGFVVRIAESYEGSLFEVALD